MEERFGDDFTLITQNVDGLHQSEEQIRSIEEMIDDDELMTAAIRQGVREELLSQGAPGFPFLFQKMAR